MQVHKVKVFLVSETSTHCNPLSRSESSVIEPAFIWVPISRFINEFLTAKCEHLEM